MSYNIVTGQDAPVCRSMILVSNRFAELRRCPVVVFDGQTDVNIWLLTC